MIRPHEETSIRAGGLLGRIKRRQLLRLGFLGGTLLLLAEIGGIFIPFMRVNKIVGLGAKVPAGRKSDILQRFAATDDAPQLFTEGKFFLTHPPGGIFAVYRKCTHLGCSVPYSPGERSPDGTQGQFACPCHGSRFNKRTAIVEKDPAPKPLQLFRMTEGEGGTLIVDTNPLNVIDRPANVFDPAHIQVRDS